MTKAKTETQGLLAAVTKHAEANGPALVDKFIVASAPLLTWISYLRTSVSKNTCDRLLDTAHGAIVESTGCVALGLVRPSLLGIRAQQDLLLAWMYYNDHPIEWSHFENGRDDFMLRAAVRKYLANFRPRFAERYKLLASVKTRTHEEPYSLLSAHVHSYSVAAARAPGPLTTLVASPPRCAEAVQLQAEVVEYLSDTFASWYTELWHDYPKAIRDAISSRLKATELKAFSAA